MPKQDRRRCSACSTSRTLRRRDGVDACPACEVFERAEIREAAVRVLEELRHAAVNSPIDEHVSTAEALRLGIRALENEAANYRKVGNLVRRMLEATRSRRKAAT